MQIGAQMHRVGAQPPAFAIDSAAIAEPGQRRYRLLDFSSDRQAEQLQQQAFGVGGYRM